ncbi:MAG: hypothetical protein K0Q50_1164 [Vampirovibrio sp.]|jgi:hypothetical protein|nr:hypothetical protein [Vampirovibrio sp.]
MDNSFDSLKHIRTNEPPPLMSEEVSMNSGISLWPQLVFVSVGKIIKRVATYKIPFYIGLLLLGLGLAEPYLASLTTAKGGYKPEWKQVSSNDFMNLAIEKNGIRKEGTSRIAWIEITFININKLPQKDRVIIDGHTAFSQEEQLRINCAERTSQTMERVMRAKSGDVLSTESLNELPRGISPNSMLQNAFNFACSL